MSERGECYIGNQNGYRLFIRRLDLLKKEWMCVILFIKSLGILFSFIKKITRKIFVCIWRGQKSVIGLQRVLMQGSWEKLECNLGNKNKSLWVLGNGPSLAAQLQEYLDAFLQHDIMCMNHFASTEYFEKLKPRYYVMVDPFFWGSI